MDQNQKIIKHYINELNKRNFSILDEMLAKEIFVNSEKISKSQYKQNILDRIAQFPDYKVEIKKMETKEGAVILYWHRTGVNPKTGEVLNEDLTSEYQIKDGKICGVD